MGDGGGERCGIRTTGGGDAESTKATGGEDRGIAAVVGVIIIVGLVAVGSVLVLVVGQQVTDNTNDRVQDEKIGTAYQELDAEVSSVAVSESGASRVTDFDIRQQGGSGATAVRREAASFIIIEVTKGGDTTASVFKDLGAITYEGANAAYAYESGAVWRGSGDDVTMVRAPRFRIVEQGSNTVSLSADVNELHGDKRLPSGEIQAEKMFTEAPLGDDIVAEPGEKVSISYTGPYYEGWARYLERETPSSATVTTDDSSQTVTVDLNRPGATTFFQVSVHNVCLSTTDTDPDCPFNNGPVPGSGVLYTADGDGNIKVIHENRSTSTIEVPGDVKVLGETADIDDDDKKEVVYSDGDAIRAVDGDGETNFVTDEDSPTSTPCPDSDPNLGGIPTQKSRIAVASWDGSDEAVYFTDSGNNNLWKANPTKEDNTSVLVASVSDGAQGAIGPADLDGDSDESFVISDGSQTLRYLESHCDDPTDQTLEKGDLGSNEGLGLGQAVDFDGNDKDSVTGAATGNKLKIAGLAESEGGEGTEKIDPGTEIEKTSLTHADIDNDGAIEIVFVEKASPGHIMYVDDVRGENTVKYLRDDEGNKIEASEKTGLVS